MSIESSVSMCQNQKNTKRNADEGGQDQHSSNGCCKSTYQKKQLLNWNISSINIISYCSYQINMKLTGRIYHSLTF